MNRAISAPNRLRRVQPIEVSFNLEVADVVAARRALLLSSPRPRLGLVAVVVVFGVALALGSWAIAIGVVVWVGVMGLWLFYLNPRRALRTRPSLRGRQTWQLGSDVLSCEVMDEDGNRLADTDLSWRSMTRFRESGALFLLSSAQGPWFVLPKRALDPSAVSTVRALFSARAL